MKTLEKSKGGRPTKYSPIVVSKLKAAFANSFSVDQACIYAGITKDTFYKWLESRKGFSDQMIKARERPTMKAKEVVVESINSGDATSAKWWLERRAPDEFGVRINQTQQAPVTNNFVIIASEQKEKYGF